MPLCIIPARGGSKRIPRKNIKPFNGKPMIAHSIAAAQDSGCFSQIIVSTDDPEIAAIAARITLHQGNAAALMPALAAQTGQPDVVYLDPMYPERQKSAAVKKEMAYFHALLGQPENERGNPNANDAALFQAARAVAKKRIVVKRPRLGAFLCGEKPAYQYAGKSTRFDVYLPKAA